MACTNSNQTLTSCGSVGGVSRNREVDCIEVPKVFDQCLIRRCLVFGERTTNKTDPQLREVIDGMICPGEAQRFIGCRDFTLTINNITKAEIAGEPGFKRITVNFTITFLADVALTNGSICTLCYTVTRTETVGRLYCPESVALIAISRAPRMEGEPSSIDLSPEIIKLEMVPECLTGEFVQLSGGRVALDITLAYFLIIKCELIVELLVPTFGYCPTPAPCSEISPANLCQDFSTAPVPKFFPPQLSNS